MVFQSGFAVKETEVLQNNEQNQEKVYIFADDSGNRSDIHSGERESGERPELYLQLYFPSCVCYFYATG